MTGKVLKPRFVAVATSGLVGAALLGGCGAGGPETIGSFLDDTLPAGSSGTLVAAVGDDLVRCEGWGESDREQGVAAGCDTVYDIMSMTKQFTAAAVLTLQEQGALAVTDPISRHLDDIPADKRAVTVEQLLTHTAGFVDSLGEDDEPLTKPEFLHRALTSELQSAPGSTYLYSNVGYSLLAAIIESASGTSYERYMADQLFGPAGMDRTGYVLPTWDPADLAVEYDAAGVAQGTPQEHPWADDGPYWNLRGNGGLLSTARDIYRWHRALVGDRVLDEAAKEQLFEPRVREEPDGDTFYGYGWVLHKSGDGVIAWHNGANDWAYGEIERASQERTLVFWITNQARSDEGWDFEDLGPDITDGITDRLLAGS
ncbi:beta-lactamase [Beutenbergia cavernae DSM 12333]|uniref:Beta-lactamase n=1 Tax=Beutenbergia cavernae (strain ATCC BAA-8 / DSM 12333 / CCUG 43141 / JCM 11478 / NBRC 16432 / NCIMB 13614 / HKI 0122) TaxID=471853 RepID=C5C6C9_BEUC1|nr:serine hydrolase domain-containing protein [Beutenbergia cavernae]ACQ80335.1 beta-lactamase [Beutenbergia cavernae DSM 12333]